MFGRLPSEVSGDSDAREVATVSLGCVLGCQVVVTISCGHHFVEANTNQSSNNNNNNNNTSSNSNNNNKGPVFLSFWAFKVELNYTLRSHMIINLHDSCNCIHPRNLS